MSDDDNKALSSVLADSRRSIVVATITGFCFVFQLILQTQISKLKGPLETESNSPACTAVETEAREGISKSRREWRQSWDSLLGRLCLVRQQV